MSCLSRVVLAVMCSGVALAQAQSAPSAEEDAAYWAARKARAESLHAEAQSIRQAADDLRARDDASCRKAFLENACHDRARDRWLIEINKARTMELEQAALERSVRMHDFAERQSKQSSSSAPRSAASSPSAEASSGVATPERTHAAAESSRSAPKPSAKPIDPADEARKEADRQAEREKARQAAALRAAQARADAARYEARKRDYLAKKSSSSSSARN